MGIIHRTINIMQTINQINLRDGYIKLVEIRVFST